MVEDKHQVKAAELPICPFCQGPVYYDNWVTHRIFQMECEKCKAHWRTGILNNPKRDMFVELIRSDNPEISEEYINKKLSLSYWQKLNNISNKD